MRADPQPQLEAKQPRLRHFRTSAASDLRNATEGSEVEGGHVQILRPVDFGYVGDIVCVHPLLVVIEMMTGSWQSHDAPPYLAAGTLSRPRQDPSCRLPPVGPSAFHLWAVRQFPHVYLLTRTEPRNITAAT
jgi:hypothetical protein